MQRPQGARLFAVAIGLGQVGLAHFLDQHADAPLQRALAWLQAGA